ncbi:MAG: hypothetical protein ABSB35_18865 [Bryobacteraceae bacterium]|jgi:hypothetical protein
MSVENFLKDVKQLKTNDQAKFAEEANALAKKHLGEGTQSEPLPFGLRFREKATLAPNGTTATVSVTISIPPDTDTDPPD